MGTVKSRLNEWMRDAGYAVKVEGDGYSGIWTLCIFLPDGDTKTSHHDTINDVVSCLLAWATES